MRKALQGFISASALAALLLATLAPGALAQDAYVGNAGSRNASAIDTQTHRVLGAPILVGSGPEAIAITPDGKNAYVGSQISNKVSVIDIQTNGVGSPIRVGFEPSDRDHPRRQERLRRRHGLEQGLGNRHPDQPGGLQANAVSPAEGFPPCWCVCHGEASGS